MEDKIQVVLDVKPEQLDAIEKMTEACGFKEPYEFINEAIGLMCWCARQVSVGREIASIDVRTQKYHQLATDYFTYIKEHALLPVATT